jgi:hypothetical protein
MKLQRWSEKTDTSHIMDFINILLGNKNLLCQIERDNFFGAIYFCIFGLLIFKPFFLGGGGQK